MRLWGGNQGVRGNGRGTAIPAPDRLAAASAHVARRRPARPPRVSPCFICPMLHPPPPTLFPQAAPHSHPRSRPAP
eukprot:scaffold6577_cov101-Isochrysis_galbana.AAC.1